MTALEFDALTAGYGEGIVLREVSLTVAAGESVAVIGRNGAGKSTLLNSVFGVPRIRSGTIRIGGNDLTRSRAYRPARAGVSMSPQGRRILPNLTIEENLKLGAAADRAGHWSIDTVNDLFPILRERRRKLGTELSGGQQQMLAIGRALMANPQVLLLDEPSEGLAPVIIDELAEALREVQRSGVGLLTVEQHLGLVRRVADRFVLLEKGVATHEEPIANLDNDEVKQLLAL
ncbi:ABC transporter ATP-binding protein [Actinacidiphila sp. ITFR-21]|uniref:ABC transporter ATP-binding protein n=1 Tax=Actinacidiphila sp. ITFR-21 TaxID=3075199 RepID=UPI00288BE0E5|nr:ABC transporter ATP-binding protein [Streptomyces sp. ITFR-21]WNI18750.1 ABC transporter ATP-binding protein [Streptomyces sp. ITFR-21]